MTWASTSQSGCAHSLCKISRTSTRSLNFVLCCLMYAVIGTFDFQYALTDWLINRYPNIACELLTSDVGQITDSLVTEPQLLDKIMAFIDSGALLNPLQTSFFGKVVGLLITRKSEVVQDLHFSFCSWCCSTHWVICVNWFLPYGVRKSLMCSVMT